MTKKADRRGFLIAAAASAVAIGAPAIARATPGAVGHRPSWLSAEGRLKIGLLWSHTGGLSVIEKASRDVALFWIDQVNRDGGVAGFKIEPVILDAKSDIKAYREGALHLMKTARVLAIFGGYTSASRRAVMPLIELNEGLLFYPASYAGRECWQRIVCTGPIANQQSFDLIPYMCQRYGTRVYFLGSNNGRSQESNRYAKHRLAEVGGEVVGTSYIPVGHGEFSQAFSDIRAKRPDWLFSTVVGASDIQFRIAYAKAGFRPDSLPTASLTTSEAEVKVVGPALGEGHFVSAPYFQSIASPANRRFVEAFLQSPYGADGVTHHTMEATYLAFAFFKRAVERFAIAQGVAALTPETLRAAAAGLSLSAAEAPQGPVRIDPDNFNSWLTPKIGRFDTHGQVEVLQQRSVPVRPEPFVLYPSRGTCRSDGLHLPHGQVVKAAS